MSPFPDSKGFKDVCLGALFYPEVVKHPVTWDGFPEEGLRGDGVLHALLCPQSVHGKVPHLELLVLFLLLKTQLFNVNGTFPHFVLLCTQSIHDIDSTTEQLLFCFLPLMVRYHIWKFVYLLVHCPFMVHSDLKILYIVSSYVNF